MSTRASLTLAAAVVLAATASHAQSAGRCLIGGSPAMIVMKDVGCSALASGKNGQGEVWTNTSSTATQLTFASAFDSGEWIVGATSDFDGDGACDVAWVDEGCSDPLDRKMTVTLASPSAGIQPPQGIEHVYQVPKAWVPVGSGQMDYLGDPVSNGWPAIVWWDPVAYDLQVWPSDGGGAFPEARRSSIDGPLAGGWTPVAVADLDGAGLSEIVWRNAVSGNLVYWGFQLAADGTAVHTTGGYLTPSAAGANQHIRGASDLDGDGKDDLVFQDASSGLGVVWYMNGPVAQTTAFVDPQMAAVGGLIYGPR